MSLAFELECLFELGFCAEESLGAGFLLPAAGFVFFLAFAALVTDGLQGDERCLGEARADMQD